MCNAEAGDRAVIIGASSLEDLFCPARGIPERCGQGDPDDAGVAARGAAVNCGVKKELAFADRAHHLIAPLFGEEVRRDTWARIVGRCTSAAASGGGIVGVARRLRSWEFSRRRLRAQLRVGAGAWSSPALYRRSASASSRPRRRRDQAAIGGGGIVVVRRDLLRRHPVSYWLPMRPNQSQGIA